MPKTSRPIGPVKGCTSSTGAKTRDGTIIRIRIKRDRCCLVVKQSTRLITIRILCNNILDIMANEYHPITVLVIRQYNMGTTMYGTVTRL
jgi:hypothetical protein